MQKHLGYISILCMTSMIASPALAVQCNTFTARSAIEWAREDPAKILENIDNGCPVPPGALQSAGRPSTLPGAGSNVTQSQNSPDLPPAAAGAPASIGNNSWGQSLNLPPWQGFPCQLPGGTSICGGSSGGSGGGSGGASGGGSGGSSGGADACPVRDDASGTFGQRVALSNQSLPCGGSVGLGNTQYSMTPNANRLAIIEDGQAVIKLYELGSFSVPSTTGGSTSISGFAYKGDVPLPTFVCKPGHSGILEKSADLQPPSAQIFAYSTSTPRLIVRLKQEAGRPFNDPFAPDPEAPAEKFLIIPVSGGTPQNIAACPNEATYYKSEVPDTADIDVFPKISPSCNSTTLYPTGEACKDKMLVLVTDVPQLVHEPNQNAQFYPIEGQPYVMARTTADSMLTMQSGTIRIGTSGLKFTLPDGGIIPLKDGNFLRMSGPAEISSSASNILLKSGGQIEDSLGSVLTAYPAGSNVRPNAELPYYIKPEKRVAMPAGLMLPSQVNGYIRLPVTTQ